MTPTAVEPVKQPAATAQSISWQSLAYAVQWWLFAAFAAVLLLADA